MPISIDDYQFDGPFVSADWLRHTSGIYAVLDKRLDGSLFVVDIGQSGDVKDRVRNHDRKMCWRGSARGDLRYAALYTPGETVIRRETIERVLRNKFNPPCGEI